MNGGLAEPVYGGVLVSTTIHGDIGKSKSLKSELEVEGNVGRRRRLTMSGTRSLRPEVQIDLPWTWDLLQDPDRSWIVPIQILGFQSGSDLDLLYCFLEK